MSRTVLDNRLCKSEACNSIFEVTSRRKDRKFCSKKCGYLFLKGSKITEERRQKIIAFRNSDVGRKVASEAGKRSSYLRTEEEYKKIGLKISQSKKGKPNLSQRGENHHNRQGGISQINRTERKLVMDSLEYKNWRREVFERDDYRCVECGIKSEKGIKVVLHADHIKPYKDFPDLRLDVLNGRTLCESCHRKTDTWGGRIKL